MGHYVLLLVSWSVTASSGLANMPQIRPVQAFGSAEFDSQKACQAAISALNRTVSASLNVFSGRLVRTT
jgi:hypothetical protein